MNVVGAKRQLCNEGRKFSWKADSLVQRTYSFVQKEFSVWIYNG